MCVRSYCMGVCTCLYWGIECFYFVRVNSMWVWRWFGFVCSFVLLHWFGMYPFYLSDTLSDSCLASAASSCLCIAVFCFVCLFSLRSSSAFHAVSSNLAHVQLVERMIIRQFLSSEFYHSSFSFLRFTPFRLGSLLAKRK